MDAARPIGGLPAMRGCGVAGVNVPRMLRPLPGRPPSRITAASLSDTPVTLVAGPPGAYAAESLAALLEGQGRWQQAVWLRTGARRPGVIAVQLAGACMHRWAGPDTGDNIPLHAALHLAPRGSTVVVELGRRATPRVGRLVDDIRSVLVERASSLVVVASRRTDRLALPHDALVAAEAVTGPPATDGAGLPGEVTDRLLRMTAGRPALAHDALDAAGVWPHDAIVGAIAGRSTSRGLLDHLTATLVAGATGDQRAALELCVATGYCHPQVVTGDLVMAALRPWVVPLEQGWGWLRPVWRTAVARHLRTPATGDGAIGRRPRLTTARSGIGDGVADGVALEARMLGTFELRVDGVGVPASPGHRGYAVLRYLLARPGHAASRDEILDEFWPDVDVDIARNRLQVAVSGVRRALRDITPAPVVEYRDGGYRIAPRVSVQTDVDTFEQWLVAGAAAEADGRVRDALSAYRTAIGLWRGDYASDTPFEQWSMLPREHLRLRYVDALDHMSRLQLDAGQIDEGMATAHRMLDVDPSREDAHRLLMRCYAQQGRVHLALRQYELCVRALRATVDAAPSGATVRLRDAVLAGSVAPV
jgi:DNA-binding SARP family transcriptional activator